MNDKKNSLLMTEGDFRSKIIRFAVPVFIGHLFQQLYNTVDSLIVGNLIGYTALAAVSSTGSLAFLMVSFFMGFSTGAGIVIGRCVGAGEEKKVESAVHTTVAMGLVAGLLMTVLGVLGVPWALRLMGTPEEVFPLSCLYLRIYFGGCLGLVMYNTFVGILQASGDSRHPLYYLIVSSVLNVFLDVFFLGALHMGVEGAAIATIISQFLSAVLAFRRLLRSDTSIRLNPRRIRFVKANMVQIFRYGLPGALQGSMVDLSNLLIQSYINSFGAAAMAGIGAYSKVEGFVFLPVVSFCVAMTTFISQNRGAGKYDRMKQGIRFGERSGVLLSEAIGVIYFFLGPQILHLFSSDPEVIAFGMGRARVCSLFFCLLAYAHVSSAVLRGIGRPVVPMAVMLSCWCGVRVLVLMTIGRVWHVIGLAYWIYPITWGLSCVIYFFFNRRILRQESFSAV